MKVNKYSCKRFGGLKDKDIEFQNGLNVILGPNEAGKSTLINGIYNTIFMNSKLRMSNGADKDFHFRFRPYPDGDYFNGRVHIDHDGQQYKIEREWGEGNQSLLELSDGSIIKKEDLIKDRLYEQLSFGEGTYRNIVFARQSDIKNAIQKMFEDSETTQNIGVILRKTVMELDGLSIEKLRHKIEDELDSLLKRWDYTTSGPENNRDISNPYKTGIGLILKSYYEKRKIEVDIEKTQKVEREFEEISKEIKILKKQIEEKTNEPNQLNKLEGDVFKRAQLEPSLITLKERLETLKHLNKRWPVEDTNLENNKEQLLKLIKRIEELDEEYRKSRENEERKKLETIIKNIDDKKDSIREYLERKKELPDIEEKDVSELEQLKSIIERNKAAIEAGTLIAKLKNNSKREIRITKGLEEREGTNSDLEFTADGFLKIEIEGILDIEIKSGEIDFEALSKEYTQSKNDFENKLQRYHVKTINEAKEIRKEIKEIDNKIEIIKIQIKDLLGDNNYDDLKKKVAELGVIENIRTLDEIQNEKNRLIGEKSKLESDVTHTENIIKEWEDKYESHDKLADNMVETMTDIRAKEKELSNIQPLPKEFHSPEQFKNYLSDLRIELDELKSQNSQKIEGFYKLENQLPEISYEELIKEHTEVENEFRKLLKRASNLMRIKEQFYGNLELMDKNSFEPLILSFNKYISKMTKGRYIIENLDEDFNIKLKTIDHIEIPVELLSAGTYDGVALAFRFAILESLYKDRDGLVILDDCLVDLDPERKQEAVDIIKEFAKNNQVIFTTCSPDTAELLGGYTIKME